MSQLLRLHGLTPAVASLGPQVAALLVVPSLTLVISRQLCTLLDARLTESEQPGPAGRIARLLMESEPTRCQRWATMALFARWLLAKQEEWVDLGTASHARLFLPGLSHPPLSAWEQRQWRRAWNIALELWLPAPMVGWAGAAASADDRTQHYTAARQMARRYAVSAEIVGARALVVRSVTARTPGADQQPWLAYASDELERALMGDDAPEWGAMLDPFGLAGTPPNKDGGVHSWIQDDGSYGIPG